MYCDGLTLLAEVGEEVLFGAEAVLKLIWHEGFAIVALNTSCSGVDLHLSVNHCLTGTLWKVLIIRCLLL